MKILLVGAQGTLGRAVAAELGARHEIITAGRRSGDVRIDLSDRDSIVQAFAQVGSVDAVVSAAGNVAFAPLLELTDAQWQMGLGDKLMGQVNLALAAVGHLSDGGSITLTTGVLADQPIRSGAQASLVNSAIHGFVMGAAIELPRGIRINAVSPNVLQESTDDYAPYFRGFEPVTAARAALGFSRSVEGAETGKVYRVY
ncbi:short chain dehydrogenase [Montanilutibacter psychrotolerans]|uniref:Short chain dehydrogenase n=1 Tax=Montanilutibacter psychrotolerans TaxID=1327343 RepID=A0A3M8SQN3_9GAMM|nr:short chain dehydrogenase [Lysobacter psychrotolerans]RNF83093.1 short chain dehydrogenase [Lysobacter psychrotolerans]